MNRLSNNIGKLLLWGALPLGGAASMFSACDDYFDLKPLNQIVLENYWEDKNDVEGAVNSCYSGMLSRDFLLRYFLWGESRSDNVVYSKSGDDINLRQILEENILETNPYLDWEGYYQVINRCNSVVYYAPEVAEKDPNYAVSEMKSHVAEAVWIRSFCYFCLARTFRDIPYSNKPSINDEHVQEDYILPVTPFKDLLRQLASDLEEVKDDVLRFYPPFTTIKRQAKIDWDGKDYLSNPNNTCRVTTCAMYALLADIYLWLDDYNKCLEYTQKVFDYKQYLYDQIFAEKPNLVSDIRFYANKYPLIQDVYSSSTTSGNAYNSIFYYGNSFESILELYFDPNTQVSNPFGNCDNRNISFFYYSSSNKGVFNAYKELTNGVYAGNNKVFSFSDNRVAEYFETSETQVAIVKQSSYIQLTPSRQSGTEAKVDAEYRVSSTNNYILYRLTDVMLMRAEALIELGGDDNLNEAFALISAVYNRSNNTFDGELNCLNRESYKDQAAMRQLCRDERNRELMFEGKRWFDLVRYALRDGYNDDLISNVLPKQEKNANRIRIQLQQRDALFWPYAEREMELNPYLKQNSAYITNETSQK